VIETRFERANRLAAATKASHDERMAGLVRLNAKRRPDAFRRTGVEARVRSDWWADPELWADPGYCPSLFELLMLALIFRQAYGHQVRLMEAARPRIKPIRKLLRPLAEVHLVHLLEMVIIGAMNGVPVAAFDPKDLTDSDVAL